MEWQPITDLPSEWPNWVRQDVTALVSVWREQRNTLEDKRILQNFLDKLRRRVSIETGVIERLYTIDLGVTRLLIEHGIDAALIPHGSTDRPVSEVVALIRDQESAIEQVFNFVGANRALSTSFIKQLHQLLTKNQPTTEGIDQFGNLAEFEMTRGDWKRRPNNVTKKGGTLHEYCPPEQVASQMDQLIAWHLEHTEKGVSPEVEAAWLHHRFTQIHPFEDGNGRVARNLATLIFLRAGWFPLVVLQEEKESEETSRSSYIQALESADMGELAPLINLFADSQKKSFVNALGLSDNVITEQKNRNIILNAAIDRLRKQGVTSLSDARENAWKLANFVHQLALQRFNELQRELSILISQVTSAAEIRLSSADHNDDRAYYFMRQIIDTAKDLDYLPGLNAYRSWVRLSIKVGEITTHIIISLHELGRDPQGIMAGSAFGFRQLPRNSQAELSWYELETLCEKIFTFTYQDEREILQEQFIEWIESVIDLALIYWQRSL